jgi:RNA ligase (TIGR02306 family)
MSETSRKLATIDKISAIRPHPNADAIGGDIEGPFPGFLRKTDEERIQNCAWILEQYRDLDWVATEKLDGTSGTYFWKDGEFGICSRDFKMKQTPGNLHGRLAEKLGLAAKLARYGRNIALQGEIVGPKVQGNPYRLEEPQVRFFNLFDINRGEYEDHPALVKFCWDMDLPRVQVVAFGDVLPATLPQVLEMAEGRSLLNGDKPREGLVFRPMFEVRDSKLGRLSFKAISNQWLLSEK